MPLLAEPDRHLLADLAEALGPARVLARPLDRLARSADASIYRLVPEVVVRPRSLEDVAALLRVARRHGRALTFRAAGTSLSGQAVTEGVLVELAHDWGAFRVLDGGRRVWGQPGVTGGRINRGLLPLGRRLGPDPASIDAAMLGGILANNSSGMCCGAAGNSYNTLESLVVLLADGTLVDGSQPDADAQLPPALRAGLLRLRDDVRADAALVGLVRRKFAGKNTTGYSLNAFLDFDSPAAILTRLMVGSQGTLGFVSEATLRTVPDPPARATALLLFERLREAGALVPALAAAGAAALEVLDACSLRSQAGERALPVAIGADTAALLVELQAENGDALSAAVARAEAALHGVPLLAPAAFTRDPAERERHWRLRKGLFPAVGAARPPGTAVVIEDVAVPVERLAAAIADLQALLGRHGYADTAVFGHAKDGNLHFVLAQDFSRPAEVERYGRFMQELVELIAGRHGGALKAEHGSGRNMAPFVRAEWGPAAYAVMRRVKALLDPEGLLNPGVLLSDDPRAHLRNLKDLPAVAASVDRCIECGFCEPRCPSRDVTLSPRQRIVAARELARLERSPGAATAKLRAALQADFEHAGILTCIGDGMCATACPVGIDTGQLVKELRSAARPAWEHGLARQAARHFGLTAAAARAALRLATRLRPGLALPAAAARLPALHAAGADVVYFPSCLSRILGSLPGEPEPPLPEVVLALLRAAGFSPRYPAGVEALCCGLPFASKAFPAAAEEAGERCARALQSASDRGRLPILTDASPCAAQLETALRRLPGEARALDFPAFWARLALPRLPPPARVPGAVVLHPTCSLLRSGGLPDLLAVAAAHAERVLLPASVECCGFGGDRGWLVPEVTAAATRREAEEVRALAEGGAAGYSTCRTCELGLARASGRPYGHVARLVQASLRHGAR